MCYKTGQFYLLPTATWLPVSDSRQRCVQRIEWDASHFMALAGSAGAMAFLRRVPDVSGGDLFP